MSASFHHRHSTLQRTILRYREGIVLASHDALLVESPLAVIVNTVPYAALMCTPGKEIELALGFCMTERLILSGEECHVAAQHSSDQGYTVHLTVSGGAERIQQALQGRTPFVGVSCCGNRSATTVSSLVRSSAGSAVGADFALQPRSLQRLQKEAEVCQHLFTATGATHFCALYNDDLSLTAYAEDVGRHNALDKAAGETFRAGTAHTTRLVLLSSRLSYEMVQKALSINAQMIAGLSAVTSAAVALADEAGITLVGFLRSPRCNIYTHPERLGMHAPAAPKTAEMNSSGRTLKSTHMPATPFQ